jgi:hypothetical protein
MQLTLKVTGQLQPPIETIFNNLESEILNCCWDLWKQKHFTKELVDELINYEIYIRIL